MSCQSEPDEVNPVTQNSHSSSRVSAKTKIERYFFEGKEYSKELFYNNLTIKSILEDDKHCLYTSVEDTERTITLFRTFDLYLTETKDLSFNRTPNSSENSNQKLSSDFNGSFNVAISLYDGYNYNYYQASAIGYSHINLFNYQPGSFQPFSKSTSDFSQNINNFTSFGYPAVSTFNDKITSYQVTISSDFMPWQLYWKRPKVKVYMFKNSNFGGASLVTDVRCPFANGYMSDNTEEVDLLGASWNNKISSIWFSVQ